MFEARATEKELLDEPDCSPELAAASYRFMEMVNARFGGVAVVRRFISQQSNAPLRVLDIGSGSCDIPLAVSRWARRRGRAVRFTCLEPAAGAAAIARERLAAAGDPAVGLLQEDAFEHAPVEPYDCAVSSMCFHHLGDEEILRLLERMRSQVRGPVLINDLLRSRWSALVTRALLAVVGAPAGVRHDALLSIRRGFRPDELSALLSRLPHASATVTTAPFFRVVAVIKFEAPETNP
ncbi:methyltransferase type 12 [candidate division BRC1 bacterium HGW-BRC1-1]|jgi:hypothetical protein|nr:MAG: methyltransferase type 12 [candidate division BRC1 bacterium HGW-BRC1-1]